MKQVWAWLDDGNVLFFNVLESFIFITVLKVGPAQIVSKYIKFTGNMVICDANIEFCLEHPGCPGTLKQQWVMAAARCEHIDRGLVVTVDVYG